MGEGDLGSFYLKFLTPAWVALSSSMLKFQLCWSGAFLFSGPVPSTCLLKTSGKLLREAR